MDADLASVRARWHDSTATRPRWRVGRTVPIPRHTGATVQWTSTRNLSQASVQDRGRNLSASEARHYLPSDAGARPT
jgi:hypothetical protein